MDNKLKKEAAKPPRSNHPKITHPAYSATPNQKTANEKSFDPLKSVQIRIEKSSR
jgi:hypothetical protein